MSVPAESSVDPEPEEREVAISGQDRKLESAEDVAETVRDIEQEEALTTLRLSGNSMGVQAAQAIAGALSSRPTLRRALWSDMFVGRLRSEIPPALTTLSDAVMAAKAQLVELDLSHNAFGPAGIQAIFRLLTSSVCFSLRVLKLNNTGMGIQGGEIIDLNDNTFTEEGAATMATVLPSLQQLRIIDFGDCLVRSGGAQAIAAAIADSHPNLEAVCLGYNSLDTQSALTVVEALSNKKALIKIDLNGNNFGETGVESVRECVEANGLEECLASLSDDEGSDNEEEEEKEEEEEPEQEEEEDAETEQEEEDCSQEKVSVEEYLREPSAENLLGMGVARAELVANSLGESWSGEEAGRMYVKVASCYSEDISCDLRQAVENTIDAVVRPVCEAGQTALLLNEILVQIGLLKSEDKKFKPVTEIEGPVLALTHLVRQSYFPKDSRDTLITFIQKPHQALTATRPKVLQVLYAS